MTTKRIHQNRIVLRIEVPAPAHRGIMTQNPIDS